MRGSRHGWDPDKITIKFAPTPKEMYWIASFRDAKEPEFTGYHPGVIISGTKTLNDSTETVSFVPMTSIEPYKGATGRYPPYVFQLPANPNPLDAKPVWAICNHIKTVRLSRLEQYVGHDNIKFVPKLSEAEFDGVVDAVFAGYIRLRARMDRKRDDALQSLKDEHANAISDLHDEFEARMARRELELMEEWTAPSGERS